MSRRVISARLLSGDLLGCRLRIKIGSQTPSIPRLLFPQQRTFQIDHYAKRRSESHNSALRQAKTVNLSALILSRGSPMQQKYVPLAEGNKHNRRSLADAIELLNAHAGFHTNDRATIRTSQLLVAAKEPLVQLYVIFQSPSSKVTFLVSLPASSHCTSMAPETNAFETIATLSLNDVIRPAILTP
jgi:hypothetical protein